MRTLIFATPSSGSSEFKRNLIKRFQYDIDFGEIFNPRTFKKKLTRNIINNKEWQNFCKQTSLVDITKLIAEYQIQKHKDIELLRLITYQLSSPTVEITGRLGTLRS